MANVIAIVRRIDERTRDHGRHFESFRDCLENIAANTLAAATNSERMADSLTSMQTDNRELSQLAAGKNQVPAHLLLVILVLGGVFFIAERIHNSGIDIKIPWLGVEIVQHDEREKGVPDAPGR